MPKEWAEWFNDDGKALQEFSGTMRIYEDENFGGKSIETPVSGAIDLDIPTEGLLYYLDADKRMELVSSELLPPDNWDDVIE